MAARQHGERVGAGAPRRRDEQRALRVAGEACELGAERRGDLRREAEGLALPAEQHGDARVGQRLDARGVALARFGQALRRHAMHRAEGGDDVWGLEAVMHRGGDEIEQSGRHFRILDVQGESVRLGKPLDGERDRHAAPADGNDKTRPGRFELLVGRDGAQQPRRRQQELQRRRNEFHRPGRAHPPQAEGETDGFRHGDALRFHPHRAVGDDPGLLAPRLLAAGDQGRGIVRRRISGTFSAQFLFDSFSRRI